MLELSKEQNNEWYSIEEKKEIQRAYRQLLSAVRVDMSTEDRAMIRKAYRLAVEAHAPQRRKTGEAYIFHPIEVARICAAEIGLGTTSIVAALLHDVVEDTNIPLSYIEEQFDSKIAKIVDGLTKLDREASKTTLKADNFMKVLSTLVFDVRVILIKMADRLHNLRTIEGQTEKKRLEIAAETDYFYSPIAHRLGLYQIKTDFQDLCLKIREPEEYQKIKHKLKETRRARDRYINEFIKPLVSGLDEMGVKYRIFGRPKSIFSIWNKIKTKQVDFEDMYDLFAIRVVIDVPFRREKPACWEVYSVITDNYLPIAERLKDWVANPKSNGYESLHTTVIGPDGRYVEVQIRSERMDDIAEHGFAAHWKYKKVEISSSVAIKKKDVYDEWLDNVREILDTNNNDALEFLAEFKTNLFSEELYVYTPSGEMRTLPVGATALDFAFDIHTDVGSHAISIKIGNRLVPMSYKLQNGDQVFVTTNKNQKPTEDWLKMVITSKARGRIRAALKDEMKLKGSIGKETLERKLEHLKVDFEENCDMLVKYFGFSSRTNFFYAISLGEVNLLNLKKLKVEGRRLVEPELLVTRDESKAAGMEAREKHKVVEAKPSLFINDQAADYIEWGFASCCTPVMGDSIFAYNTQHGMKIHRDDCPNAGNLKGVYGYRVARAHWGYAPKAQFVADLIITGVDTGVGVIESLSHNIATKLGLNIRRFNIEALEGYFECHIGLVVSNSDQLHLAIEALKSLESVNNVMRVEKTQDE
jgi:GTP pyrophosphokinase